METAGKSGGVDPAVRLVRRLNQLNAGFRRKIQQAERSQSHWQECKFLKNLYGQVTEDTKSTRVSYDNVILSFEELELAVPEAVWEKEYKHQKDEIEHQFSRFIDHIGEVTVDFESACVAERFREAEAIAAVTAPAPAPGAAGGGERGAMRAAGISG